MVDSKTYCNRMPFSSLRTPVFSLLHLCSFCTLWLCLYVPTQIKIRATTYKVISVYCLLKDHNGISTFANKLMLLHRKTVVAISGGWKWVNCNENELRFIEPRLISVLCFASEIASRKLIATKWLHIHKLPSRGTTQIKWASGSMGKDESVGQNERTANTFLRRWFA